MRTTGSRVREGAGAPPIHLAHCDNPLEFLAEEHFRERSICALIDAAAAAASPDKAAIRQVLDFLSGTLPAHVHAELAHFFPLLQARCPAEDDITPVIDAVIAEHDHTMSGLPELERTLRRRLADGLACTEAERLMLRDFAAHVRRHVVVENAILMPIARARLSKADLSSLRTNMLKSREPPSGGEDDAG